MWIYVQNSPKNIYSTKTGSTVYHTYSLQYLAMLERTTLRFPEDMQFPEMHPSLQFQRQLSIDRYDIIQSYHVRCA